MRALEYRFSPAGWVTARVIGRRLPGQVAAIGGLRLVDRPPPRLPGPDWVLVRPVLAGICGSDLGTITAKLGPQYSPYVSLPAVLGHEVIARVETPSGPWSAGQRVVFDPFLSCATRGLPLCPACLAGRTAACERFAEGAFSPGYCIGFCRDLPGGWGQQVAVPAASLFAVPDGIDDQTAVLIEPLAVALHAVLATPPRPGDRVLIIGAGPIGLLVLAAIRLLELDCEVTIAARYPAQQEAARAFGAQHIVSGVGGAQALAIAQGWAHRHAGLMGTSALTGGFEQCYDAVGSGSSLSGALGLVRSGGRVAMLGAIQAAPVDMSWLWMHEVRLDGFCAYGREAGGEHTFDVALRLVVAHPGFPLRDLVTHRFPLQRYPEAIGTCLRRGAQGALKVVFEPNAEATNA